MVLPVLIAGPILRRVEPTSVTVWLAFSKKQTTKLIIWDSGTEGGDLNTAKTIQNEMVQSEPFETIEIANSLHIALITADTSTKRMVETKTYSYNVYYGDSGGALNNDLGTSKLLHEPAGTDAEKFIHLGYEKGLLPTILIPAEKLENLHIVHGSCRKIHGNGDEALRHLDTLIKNNFKTPNKRPQQLYLTGDQIYADEIPKIVSPFINALGIQLSADKKEQLILKATSGETIKFPADMEHFPPNFRQFLVNDTAKFTGTGVGSHLLSFQEFCATYLHYWSPDVWHPDLKLMLTKYKESNYDEVVGSFHYYYLVNVIKNFNVEEMTKFLFKTESAEELSKKINAISDIGNKLKTEPGVVSDTEKAKIVNETLSSWISIYNKDDAKITVFDEVVKMLQHVAGMNEDEKALLDTFFSLSSVISESRASVDFMDALPSVRRALANIPCYMIFDDHEMTDDWNFSQFWKNRVYTSSLGVQVIRNGMMAYTIFQDLGNVPAEYPFELLNPNATDLQKKTDSYRDAFGKIKGNKLELLKKISEYGKAISAGNSPEAPADLSNSIDQLLLVGTSSATDDFVKPLRWHYDVPCGPAQTYFLDTRTRREYDEFTGSPGLLPQQALDDQLPEKIADLKKPVIFVISPVPALGSPVIEEFAQPFAGSLESEFKFADDGVGGAPAGAISGALQRDNEAWGFSEKHLEQFLERLALFKKVVILSGDVHYGYSAYADYWKQRKQENHARIVQLVSSSIKNGWDLDFILLKSGLTQRLLTGFDFKFEKHGWKDKSLDVKGNMAPRHRMRLKRNPIVLPRQGWYDGTKVDPAEPDWAWLLTIPADETEYKNIPDHVEFQFEITKDLTEEAVQGVGVDVKQTVIEMADRHNSIFKMGRTRRIVWQPHVGHIFFTKSLKDANRFVVNHEFNYTCRTDGFLNGDLSPDPDEKAIAPGPFTLHAIDLDASAEDTKPPVTLNEKVPEPVPEPVTN